MESKTSEELIEDTAGQPESLQLKKQDDSQESMDPRLFDDAIPTVQDVPFWFRLSLDPNSSVIQPTALGSSDGQQNEEVSIVLPRGEEYQTEGERVAGSDLPRPDSFGGEMGSFDYTTVDEPEISEVLDNLMCSPADMEKDTDSSPEALSHSPVAQDSPEPEDYFDPDHPLMVGVIYIKFTEVPHRGPYYYSLRVVRKHGFVDIEEWSYPPTPLRECRTMIRLENLGEV